MIKRVDAGLYLLAGAVVILVCAIYGQFLFGNRIFIFFKEGSDTYFQYWPLDRYFGEVLRSGHVTNWTFRIGLGKEMLPWVGVSESFPAAHPPAAARAPAERVRRQDGARVRLRRVSCGAAISRAWGSAVGPPWCSRCSTGSTATWRCGANTTVSAIVFSLVPLTLWAYEELLTATPLLAAGAVPALFQVTSFYFFCHVFRVLRALRRRARRGCPRVRAARPALGLRAARVLLRRGAAAGSLDAGADLRVPQDQLPARRPWRSTARSPPSPRRSRRAVARLLQQRVRDRHRISAGRSTTTSCPSWPAVCSPCCSCRSFSGSHPAVSGGGRR